MTTATATTTSTTHTLTRAFIYLRERAVRYMFWELEPARRKITVIIFDSLDFKISQIYFLR